ncbi:hypothetical protein HO675_01655 [Streptococcus suis]|nr:hypothetical protein [Streptococcus suis]
MDRMSQIGQRLLGLKHYLTRRNIELAAVVLIFICTLSVFTSRIPSDGALKLNNGSLLYSGQVVTGKMNGFGKLTYENGDTYSGEFKNGVFSGQGTYTAAAGWIYEGQFKNGVADGKGKLTTETNTVYEGTFKQGIYQNAN